MKKYIYPILCTLLIVSQGCDHFLGNKPKGYAIPEAFEDYVKLFASQSLNSCMSTDAFYLTDDVHLLDDTVSAADLAYANQDDHERNLYSFKGGQIYTPGSDDNLWNAAYERIYTFNTIINNVLSSTDATDAEKHRLRAEALYLRAFEYLALVNIYARHYHKETAATDYGIPLITKDLVDQKYTRATVAEVYKQIEDDLKEASKSLKEVPINLFHPYLGSLHSFYARLYLYMGRYDDALTEAKEALKLNDQLQDLRPYQTKDKTTWGRIVLPDGTPMLEKDDNPEAVFVRLQSGRVTIPVSKDFLATFERNLPAGATDQRRALFYADDTVNMGRTDYFYGETCYILYAYQNVGFSTVENMLIAAECEARVGSKDNAMSYVNKLRDNRIKNNVALTATDKDEALRIVLDERRREFAFTGFHRLIDLKRLNYEDKFKKTVTHTADGETFTLAPNDNRYIFPINQMILNYNPGMPQYER